MRVANYVPMYVDHMGYGIGLWMFDVRQALCCVPRPGVCQEQAWRVPVSIPASGRQLSQADKTETKTQSLHVVS
jgi:hypothetical protein